MGLTRKLLGPAFATIWCTVSLSACDEIRDYFSSVSFVEVAAERTRLIDGLESYTSIAEPKGKLPTWDATGGEQSQGGR